MKSITAVDVRRMTLYRCPKGHGILCLPEDVKGYFCPNCLEPLMTYASTGE